MEIQVPNRQSFFYKNKESLFLFVFSFVLRAITATLGAPHSYHSDEHWIFAPAFEMAQKGSWDLDWFRVPPLLIMMFKQVVGFLQLVAPADITLPKESWFDPLSIMPSQFPILYVGRLLVSAFASGSVVIFYLILRRIVTPKLSFLFSILYSGISSVLFYSSFLRPEALVIFFLLISVYFLMNLEKQTDTKKNVIIAGAAFGFACACKYNAAFFFLSAVYYLFLIRSNFKNAAKNISCYLVSALFFFIISVPQLFWKLTSVVSEVASDYAYYKEGDLAYHNTKLENFNYYLFTLYRTDSFFILFWLFVVFLCFCIIFHKKICTKIPGVVYLSFFFVLSYILFLSSFTYTAERNITFVYPFLLFPVAVGVDFIFRQNNTWLKRSTVTVLIAVTTTTVFYSGKFIWLTRQTLPQDRLLSWLDHNVPKKSFILREIGTPLIDPRNFAVVYNPTVAAIRPEALLSLNPNYIVLTGFTYRLRYSFKNEYPREFTEWIWAQLPVFDDRNEEGIPLGAVFRIYDFQKIKEEYKKHFSKYMMDHPAK